MNSYGKELCPTTRYDLRGDGLLASYLVGNQVGSYALARSDIDGDGDVTLLAMVVEEPYMAEHLHRRSADAGVKELRQALPNCRVYH